jgi:hypothetical protein
MDVRDLRKRKVARTWVPDPFQELQVQVPKLRYRGPFPNKWPRLLKRRLSTN